MRLHEVGRETTPTFFFTGCRFGLRPVNRLWPETHDGLTIVAQPKVSSKKPGKMIVRLSSSATAKGGVLAKGTSPETSVVHMGPHRGNDLIADIWNLIAECIAVASYNLSHARPRAPFVSKNGLERGLPRGPVTPTRLRDRGYFRRRERGREHERIRRVSRMNAEATSGTACDDGTVVVGASLTSSIPRRYRPRRVVLLKRLPSRIRGRKERRGCLLPF